MCTSCLVMDRMLSNYYEYFHSKLSKNLLNLLIKDSNDFITVKKIVFKYKTTKFTLSIDTANMNTKTCIFKWNKKLIVLSSYQIKRHLAVSNDEVWQSYCPWPVSLWVFHPGREQPAGLHHTRGYTVTAGVLAHQWTQQARKLTKFKSQYWQYRE